MIDPVMSGKTIGYASFSRILRSFLFLIEYGSKWSSQTCIRDWEISICWCFSMASIHSCLCPSPALNKMVWKDRKAYEMSVLLRIISNFFYMNIAISLSCVPTSFGHPCMKHLRNWRLSIFKIDYTLETCVMNFFIEEKWRRSK